MQAKKSRIDFDRIKRDEKIIEQVGQIMKLKNTLKKIKQYGKDQITKRP